VVAVSLKKKAAELIGGMAAITGAFFAGLMFARTQEKHRFEAGFHSLAYGIFVPIFFVSIGLAINLKRVEPGVLWLLLAILAVAVLGKIMGAGLGARLGGFSNLEALQLGAGMVSRGEVGLIVASVGLTQGLVNNEEFSAIVGTVLVTTLITPPMLRFLFRGTHMARSEQARAAILVVSEESLAQAPEPRQEGV
jgi:Kef-type K+ transport system membrane component KefB